MNNEITNAMANTVPQGTAVTPEITQEVVDMTTQVPVEPTRGFLDKAKDYVSPTALKERFGLQDSPLIDIGLYFGLGFLSGFIVKRYCRVVSILLLLGLGLYFLQENGIISVVVDWQALRNLLGIQLDQYVNSSAFAAWWAWAKDNVAIVVSYAVGFFLGMRVG